jgi:hypothetical protein
MDDLERNIARFEAARDDLRAAVSEAHAATKGLRAATRDAQVAAGELRGLVDAQTREVIDRDAMPVMQALVDDMERELGEHVQVAKKLITDNMQAHYDRMWVDVVTTFGARFKGRPPR